MSEPGKEGQIAIEGMLGVARWHRQHERFHSMSGLDRAAELRRDSNALKVLADRWNEAAGASATVAIDYTDPKFRAAGCPDLNDRAAVATTGILFMEGESEPGEIIGMKAKLAAQGQVLMLTSVWLMEKMEAAWSREEVLLTPELVHAARPRFMALTRTTLSAAKYGIAGRLIGAAVKALEGQDFRPAGVRADMPRAAALVRSASWLLDAAAAILAEQAGDLGLSDTDWTAYIEALESATRAGLVGAITQSAAPARSDKRVSTRKGESPKS